MYESSLRGYHPLRLRPVWTTAMVDEALCKVLCHNICCLIQSVYELGVEASFWTDDHESPSTIADTSGYSDADAWAWV